MLYFALCAVGSVFAADASKILLKGLSVSVEEGRASGAAQAVVGDLNVSADVITFYREKNVLKCDGVVTVRTGTGLVRTKDCVIELEVGEKRLFFLAKGDVRVSPKMDPIPTSLVTPSR